MMLVGTGQTLSFSLPDKELWKYLVTVSIVASSYCRVNFKSRLKPAMAKACLTSDLPLVFDVLGELDALSTLAKSRRRLLDAGFKDASIVEGSSFYCSYKGMVNPTRFLTGHTDVANDLEVLGGHILGLDGPNSGGKSTGVSGLLQNQMLVQLALPPTCETSTVSLASAVHYRGPSYAVLEEEGRLGAELGALSKLIDVADSTSLVILDEAVGGTDTNAEGELYKGALAGLRDLGAGIVFVSHNRTLLGEVEAELGVKCMHFGWQDKRATFKLEPGIGTSDSHSEAVAFRKGMTAEQIRQRVAERKRRK